MARGHTTPGDVRSSTRPTTEIGRPGRPVNLTDGNFPLVAFPTRPRARAGFGESPGRRAFEVSRSAPRDLARPEPQLVAPGTSRHPVAPRHLRDGDRPLVRQPHLPGARAEHAE